MSAGLVLPQAGNAGRLSAGPMESSPAETDLSLFVQPLADGLARLDLAVDGITCAACMPIIETGLQREPGIAAARVNLTQRRLTVDWREAALTPARILDLVGRLGFRAYPFDPRHAEGEERQEARRLLRALGVAGFAMMNIMLLSVSVWSGNVSDITPEQRDFFHWLSALIAVPAVAYAGQPFFRSAGAALKARQLNMDVPVSLGVLLAVGMSLAETSRHANHAYFDSAVMLLFFLLTGRYLDALMRRKTHAVATHIAALKAETVIKLVDGRLQDVPIGAILPGDLVLVRPGERIGVDGIVVDGASSVDQSLITGETAGVAVEPGSTVHAGTLNGGGVLKIRVSAAGSGTLLDDVTRLVDGAMQERSHYLRLADRAARLYSPVVHVAALATFIAWLAAGAAWQSALIVAITVLIITCPCALGLAIPAVEVVASGVLFRGHVLLQSGDALERLAEVDTVVFDKTGTLTLPVAELIDAGHVPARMLETAGRLALGSSHPLARALAAATGAGEPLDSVQEVAGQGVVAIVDDREIRLGSPAFCGAEHEAEAILARHPTASVMAIARGADRHVLAIGQRLRPDAAAVVAGLRQRGLGVEILSGDRSDVVAAVAAELGITAFAGSLKPADKIARLDELQQAGRHVLMVGDGLNDAPALARAHVSLSPVTAVQLTQAAADAVFLGDRLAPVAIALAVAVRARGLMSQNLWLAALYNLVAVPIAMAGLVTPLIAALAMSGSSILVTANALRARRAA